MYFANRIAIGYNCRMTQEHREGSPNPVFEGFEGIVAVRSELPLREQIDAETAVSTVRDFMRVTFKHPLLNDETRRHRERGFGRLRLLLDRGDFQQSRLVAMMVGSSIWVTGPDSDHDFVVMHNYPEDDPLYELGNDIPDMKIQTAGVEQISRFFKGDPDYDIHRTPGIGREFRWTYDWALLPLLFTPDEYVVGNLNLLSRLRKRVTGKLDSHPDIETFWNGENSFLNKLYQKLIRDWGTKPNYPYKGIRFQERLLEVSSRKDNPEEWKAQFLGELGQRRLPTFEVYSQAVEATQGRFSVT